MLESPKLNSRLEQLDRVSPGTAMRLQNAHLHSDALMAVRYASECELKKTARALALVGMTMREANESAVRYIEDFESRGIYSAEVFSMLSLTEELVDEALRENCGCKGTGS